MLKTILSALMILGSAGLAHAAGTEGVEAAEIHIFMKYEAPSRYEAKMVSTVEEPLSAMWIYYDENQEPRNAACFKGDPLAALDLFNSMVIRMNVENDMRIKAVGATYYDEETKGDALDIWAFDPDTRANWNWFPRLRRCAD